MRAFAWFSWSSQAYDSPPHATGQCQHAYFLSMRRLKLSPLITIAVGKSTMPTPPQFFTGASPDIADELVMPVVP